MKVSFVTTIFNEEHTINRFLDSLFSQTQLPDEVIIVDGGSTDNTIDRIKNYESRSKKKNINVKLIIKKGNRSVGRNEAIQKATGDIIVCSDAGNILDKKWIEEITKPFQTSPHPSPKRRGSISVDVVAGYYQGRATSIFQKCLVPYVLVMPDHVNPEKFLPATRSIAFTKKIWEKVGGFDERYSHNEDYVFANRLKAIGAQIVFAPKAIVNWIPRKTFKEAFIMFFRFALGDAESGLWRTTALLLLARYALGLYFLGLCLLYRSLGGSLILLLGVIGYFIWSVKKNEQYINDKRAWYLLPALQLTADAAVLFGTIGGCSKRILQFRYLSWIRQNLFFVGFVGIYIAFLLLTIQWGIPNQTHPFPYHMDEWHQLQAVGNTFRYGTPNMFGSANGTMFHFLYSGLYLLPFMTLQVIDPFSLHIDNLAMREKVFIVLRLQTILFGVLSLFVLAKIANLLQLSKNLMVFFFAISPLWIMLSGYFKYDIALIFWILLALFFLFRFALKPTKTNYLIAAIPVALSFSVKVSAAPLIPLYVLAYFLFIPSWKKQLQTLLLSLGTFLSLVVLFGFPDTLFGRGNVLLYLYENIIQTPATTTNFLFGMPALTYLFFRHYPVLFGYGLFSLFFISFVIFLIMLMRRKFTQQRIALFLLFAFALFVISVLPLQIYGGGNRSLVLLPFIVLIVGFVWEAIRRTRYKTLMIGALILAGMIQLYTSSFWVYLKLLPSPQEVSSYWIEETIPRGVTFGLENIPIYQNVPHIVQKEFYFNEYGVSSQYRYTYKLVDAKSKELPLFVIVTGDEIEKVVMKDSPKKALLRRLDQERYKKVSMFSVEGLDYLPWMSEKDYYFSWMGLPPQTISIYKK